MPISPPRVAGYGCCCASRQKGASGGVLPTKTTLATRRTGRNTIVPFAENGLRHRTFVVPSPRERSSAILCDQTDAAADLDVLAVASALTSRAHVLRWLDRRVFALVDYLLRLHGPRRWRRRRWCNRAERAHGMCMWCVVRRCARTQVDVHPGDGVGSGACEFTFQPGQWGLCGAAAAARSVGDARARTVGRGYCHDTCNESHYNSLQSNDSVHLVTRTISLVTTHC